MHEAGVPVNHILASATINNAKALKLDSKVGSSKLGKKANLIVPTKNPLRKIESYNGIKYIILGGLVLPGEKVSVK